MSWRQPVGLPQTGFQDMGTLHFCPLGACNKDRDSMHSRKVGMTSFATTASLPLCISHLTSQHCWAIVYLWLFPFPRTKEPETSEKQQQIFLYPSLLSRSERPQSLGENHKSKGGTDAVSALRLEIGTLQYDSTCQSQWMRPLSSPYSSQET